MKYFAAVYLLWIGISVIPAAGAITLGQIDVFRDRPTNNWTNENGNTVMPSMNVGPSALAGLEDKFPEITAPAGRADDRLTTFNLAESPANHGPQVLPGTAPSR